MVSRLSGNGNHGNGNGPLIGGPLPTVTGNHYRSLQTITANHYQPLPSTDRRSKKRVNMTRKLIATPGLCMSVTCWPKVPIAVELSAWQTVFAFIRQLSYLQYVCSTRYRARRIDCKCNGKCWHGLRTVGRDVLGAADAMQGRERKATTTLRHHEVSRAMNNIFADAIFSASRCH